MKEGINPATMGRGICAVEQSEFELSLGEKNIIFKFSNCVPNVYTNLSELNLNFITACTSCAPSAFILTIYV